AVVAQMQLEKRVVMGRVGHREAAARSVPEQDVDVLAREKLQPLVGGQLEPQYHDIRRDALHFLHAAWQHLDLDVLDAADLAAVDDEIRTGPPLPDHHPTPPLFPRSAPL